MDYRSDVGAVEARDQGVDDGQVRGISSGVDAHGILGAAAHLDEVTLALRCDAAFATGLLQ